MKQKLQGIIIGLLLGGILASGVAVAKQVSENAEIFYRNIKLVVQGREIPLQEAGVEPFIMNGSTYLPVRAVADALGQPVYWDGRNYTVYLGTGGVDLPNPTKEISTEGNIGELWYNDSDMLKDNYGNTYSRAIRPYYDNYEYEILCGMKYSKLKGVIYVSEGYSGDETTQIIIKADGTTIYKSPEMDKTSAPIPFEVDITGCNDLQIIPTSALYQNWGANIHIGDAGLYQ